MEWTGSTKAVLCMVVFLQLSCHQWKVSAAPLPPCIDQELAITADNMLRLYIDGVEVTDLQFANAVPQADFVPLPASTQVIAASGQENGKDSGILGSTGTFVTDSSWKCTDKFEDGWQLVGYDDSEWEAAYEVRQHGEHPHQDVEGIREDAYWIWVEPKGRESNAEKGVYCRKNLVETCTSTTTTSPPTTTTTTTPPPTTTTTTTTTPTPTTTTTTTPPPTTTTTTTTTPPPTTTTTTTPPPTTTTTTTPPPTTTTTTPPPTTTTTTTPPPTTTTTTPPPTTTTTTTPPPTTTTTTTPPPTTTTTTTPPTTTTTTTTPPPTTTTTTTQCLTETPTTTTTPSPTPPPTTTTTTPPPTTTTTTTTTTTPPPTTTTPGGPVCPPQPTPPPGSSDCSITGSTCITSCTGRPDGDYQSCMGCRVYATCSNGDIYDGRPCAACLVWDDTIGVKTCEYESPTCTECHGKLCSGTGAACIGSCRKRADGDYQSCKGWDVYATCTNGRMYDKRPCAARRL